MNECISQSSIQWRWQIAWSQISLPRLFYESLQPVSLLSPAWEDLEPSYHYTDYKDSNLCCTVTSLCHLKVLFLSEIQFSFVWKYLGALPAVKVSLSRIPLYEILYSFPVTVIIACFRYHLLVWKHFGDLGRDLLWYQIIMDLNSKKS